VWRRQPRRAARPADLGANNGVSGSCCSASCTFQSSATVCRARAAGACDVAEELHRIEHERVRRMRLAERARQHLRRCRSGAGAGCATWPRLYGLELGVSGGRLRRVGDAVPFGGRVCDVAENCTGSSAACPTNAFVSSRRSAARRPASAT
jgi:hypothetical protein